ncbi:MAG: carboxypeptidase regulatory-like domain-containing protein, partial [Pseudomonadota bacterium]
MGRRIAHATSLVRIRSLVILAGLVLVGNQAFAQETSSTLRGIVTDGGGGALSASTVTVRDEGTSLTRSAQTTADGTFNIRNLPVGNDYTVTVRKSGFGSQSQQDVALNLGQVTELVFELNTTNMDEVVVTATALASPVAVGPNATFDLDDLESKPAINRTIADVVRVDPRIFVDESRGDINAVQCAGKNSRFNSLTVDGVRLNDSFGLNANGYPTERMPFSYDALKQVSVELSPFDAKYGGFTACNINAVTKSGTNTISGSAFMDFTNDGLRADSLEGDNIQTSDYDETRFGFNVGGPIIEDQLFFFVAYESLDGANLFDR